MDVESMQPRLQAINGPLDEAAFRGQLQEAHHPLHRTRALQNGNCCPQILCKVPDSRAGSPPWLAPHGPGRAGRELHITFTPSPKPLEPHTPKSHGLVMYQRQATSLPERPRPGPEWLLTQQATPHALEHCLPPCAFQKGLHLLAGQRGLHQDHLVLQLHFHALDTWQEREGRRQQRADTPVLGAGKRERHVPPHLTFTNLPMAGGKFGNRLLTVPGPQPL